MTAPEAAAPARHLNATATSAVPRRMPRWLLAVLAVLTLARVALAAAMPIVLRMQFVYDDELLTSLGMSILSGGWLGDYAVSTLAKNPGYPLLLALNGLLGTPYQAFYAVLYAVACALFARALRPAVRSPYLRAAVYAFLLFAPFQFTEDFCYRAYRNFAPVAFVLAYFAGATGFYLRQSEDGEKLLVPWALAMALSLPWVFLIKENGSWVAPFCLVWSAVLVVLTLRRKLDAGRKAARIALVALPPAAALAATLAVCALNQASYGVFLTNDRMSGPFADATAALVHIDDGGDLDSERASGVWVSREALEQALDASPTLASIEDEVWAHWDAWAANWPDGEVHDDIFVWALRDAAADAGYGSAEAVSGLWTSVASELDDAFASGELAQKEGISLSKTAEVYPADFLGTWLKLSAQTFGRLWLGTQILDARVGMYVGGAGTAPHSDAYEGFAAFLGGNVVEQGVASTLPDQYLLPVNASRIVCRAAWYAQVALAVLAVPALAVVAWDFFGRKSRASGRSASRAAASRLYD